MVWTAASRQSSPFHRLPQHVSATHAYSERVDDSDLGGDERGERHGVALRGVQGIDVGAYLHLVGRAEPIAVIVDPRQREDLRDILRAGDGAGGERRGVSVDRMRPDAAAARQFSAEIVGKAEVRDPVVVEMAELTGAGAERGLVALADPEGGPGPGENAHMRAARRRSARCSNPRPR